jgi:hypothetical protein
MIGADDWNYFWSQVTGVPQTAALFSDPNNRSAPMSWDEYLAARAAKGLGAWKPRTIYTLRAAHPINYVRRVR